MAEQNEQSWQQYRSDIYLRDKGICWICNTFVNLDEYDLGHIIDRCNGGHDDYDNLAVMHNTCNRSKPYHSTLEEAIKWKMTSFLPSMKQSRGISSRLTEVHYYRTRNFHARQNKRNTKKYHYQKPFDTQEIQFTRIDRTPQEQIEYDEQIVKIKPATIGWKQGTPRSLGDTASPMYRLLPPPYRQENIFTMRETPPGYEEKGITGKGSLQKSLQIIGGGELEQEVNIKLGFQTISIIPQNGTISITFEGNESANNGIRAKTIGMGLGQIPIKQWQYAKEKGVSLKEFMATQNTLT